MIILYNKFDETLQYAVSELTKYVEKMSGFTVFPVSKHVFSMPKENIEGTVKLGLLSDFGLDESDVKDAVVDDLVDIDINGFTGYIAGSNIRSILLGVYRFLRSAGARWVRPGDDGEYLPHCDFESHSFKYRHLASHRYRGECIEGAISYENVCDTVVWLPKVGCNMFFMEQVIPFNYISRWYYRRYNPNKQNDERTFEEVGEYTHRIELLIKKCGLQLHALGHGFMLEPYGIHYRTGSDKYDLNELGKSHTALVKGERGLFHGSPNFTQLCFSNEAARRGMVNFLIEYIEKKPYIDFLHVWLADARNNHCECEECKKKTPTDFYVQILNELDEELTKRGMNNRIVFILYNDTVFPPETERIKNPDRFILLTAFSRSYSEAMSKKEYDGELPEYRRNEYNIPSDFAVNYAFLNKWREHFKGDAFIYEYYFYTDHYNDPGYTALSDVIIKDIRTLRELGFQGIVSDQTQRSFYPNGLPMAIMSEALFDEDFDENAFTDDYFKAAYGEQWSEVKGYLCEVSRLFDPKTLRVKMSVVEEDTGIITRVPTHLWRDNPKAAERFAAVPALAESFMPVIERGIESAADECRRISYEYLKLHAKYITELSKAFRAGAQGDMDKARELHAALIDMLRNDEDLWQRHYDLCLFIQCMGVKFR